MAWKIEGKIAGFFPNAGGQAQQDAYRVAFKDAAGTMHEIEKVYFLSPDDIAYFNTLTSEQKLAELATGKYDVWHRYFARTLLTGNQDVCIEYEYVPEAGEPDSITISTIGIFTSDESSSSTTDIKIFHETGVVLARIQTDTPGTQTTKYGLNGYLRTATVDNVVFHKNEKYYIQYTDNRSTSIIHPSYFENELGNYKQFKNRDDKSIANLNSGTYLGTNHNLTAFINSNEDDYLFYDSNDGILQQNVMYLRNGQYNDTCIGEIGTGSPTVEDKDAILELKTGATFIWKGYGEGGDILQTNFLHQKNNTLDEQNYKGVKDTVNALATELAVDDYVVYDGTSTSLFTNGEVYKKKSDITINDTYTSTGNNRIDELNIIEKSYNSTANKSILIQGNMYWADRSGNILKLKSGYKPMFNKSGDTYVGYDPTTLTEVHENEIYYFSAAGACPAIDMQWINAGDIILCKTDGTSSSKATVQPVYDSWDGLISVCDLSSLSTAFETVNFTTTVTKLGSISGTVVKTSYSDNYISNNFRSTSLSTDKKFYLEINGDEV